MHYIEIENAEQPKAFKMKTSRKPQKKVTNSGDYKFFKNLHPNIEKNLEGLNDFYSSLIETLPKSIHLDLFNSEIVGKTFAETHKVLLNTFVEKAEEWDSNQRNYLNDLEILLQRTLDRLQVEEVEPVIIPNANDKRFKASEWQDFPVFDYLKQSYLLHNKYVNELLESSLDGINSKTKDKAKFYMRSIMDAASPSNFPFTNPEVLREIIRTQGQNLLRGCQKLLDDNLKSNFLSLPMFTNLKDFKVGKNLATTPGKVLYEAALFQLIYYKPTTTQVYERPLLIIPPWINKGADT